MKKYMPGFKDVGIRILKNVLNDYDACIIFDSRRGGLSAEAGGVGTGKSDGAQQLSLQLNPWAYDMWRHTVFAEDWERFKFLMFRDTRPYIVSVVDEAHWFVYSGDHASRRVKETVKIYKTKRKLNRIDILCTPTIWKINDDIREGRATMRIRVEQRIPGKYCEATVWINNGEWDRQYDKWGRFFTRFRWYPMPTWSWNMYKSYNKTVSDALMATRMRRVDALEL